MTTWPATLPAPLLSGYQEGQANNLLRTEMEVGPAKVRRRTQANVRPISFSLILDDAELEDLLEFYNTMTQCGALPFDFTDVRTSDTLSCRFNSTLPFQPLGGGLYSVNISLEVLP